MSTHTEPVRKKIEDKMAAWIKWKIIHRIAYVALAITSGGVAALVAANTHYAIICPRYAWIPALFAAILTTAISVMGLQAQANAFEAGQRALERALALYDSDVDFGDKELGQAEAAAIASLKLP